MRLTIIIFLSFFSTEIFAQMNGFVYPNIPTKGTKLEDFVPKDWSILKTVTCDFNSDGTLDNAMVIKHTVPIDSSNFSPKMLLVVFQGHDKVFELNLSTFKFFGEGLWGVQGSEPFSNLELDKKSLKTTFWTGGSSVVKMEYSFQFIEKEWLLTKYMSTFYEHSSKNLWVDDVDFIEQVEYTYTKKNGKKIIDKKFGNFNFFLKNNNIPNASNKLSDINIETFIDPFKG